MAKREIWDSPKWYEANASPERSLLGFMRLVGIGTACILAICGVIWCLDVVFAGPTGKGDVIRKNNDANNQVYSEQHFQDLYADITGYTAQLRMTIGLLRANPGDAFDIQNYTGQWAACDQAVQQYDADSNKTLMKDWKSTSLPRQITVSAACPTAPSSTLMQK